MQIGLGGGLSSTKTVSMVAIACKIAKEKKKRIVSNFTIKLQQAKEYSNQQIADFIIQVLDTDPQEAQKRIEEMFGNTVFCIDEINGLLNARKSMSNLNNDILQLLMMLGKINCDLLFTYQVYESQVDKELREITPINIDCCRVRKDNHRPLLFEDRIVDFPILSRQDWQFNQNGRVRHRRKFVDPSPFYKLYSTRQILLLNRERYTLR